MKTLHKYFALVLLLPMMALAHQPRIVESATTVVIDPEISKAYYSEFNGTSQIYTIDALSDFDLYVNLLVPDKAGQSRNIEAVVTRDGESVPVVTLGGIGFAWESFYEPFGNDTYLNGPEYRAHVPAGRYTIRVTSPDATIKYSLAVGEIEAFNVAETLSAIHTIPLIKRDFFGKSPANFIFSVMGASFIAIMFVLSWIFGFLYRWIMKSFATKKFGKPQNIGRYDRFLRALFGVVIFIFAIMTSWSPLLFFFSGFCFFEAIFSWCGFYAAIGRNTCPIGQW
jgi:hypothetical protein